MPSRPAGFLLLSLLLAVGLVNHALGAGSTLGVNMGEPINGYPGTTPGTPGTAPRAALPGTIPGSIPAPIAPPTDNATMSGITVDRDAVLNPGDVVSIEIVEDREAPILKRVTDTGELEFPYIGRLKVSKKSCAEVTAEAKRDLEAKYYYHATVRLGIEQVNRLATMHKIYLAGLVMVPGPQEIAEGERLTVSEAIVRAGGVNRFGDDHHVKVTRGGKTFIVDVKKILQDGKTDADVQVEDGDHIYIPQKLVNW